MAPFRSSAHWVVPTTLLISIVVGISFAIGHHFFYQSLHGENIDTASYSQQVNQDIGLAFTYIVRAAFIVALSTAYWQILWHRLHSALPLSTIDTLAGQLSSVWKICSINTLRTSPLLAAFALLAFLIPVATIFPPGTLTVVASADTAVQEPYAVSLPNYTNTEPFCSSQVEASPLKGTWNGATSLIKRIVLSVACSGQVAPIEPPHSSSSYTLDFYGPELDCEGASDEEDIVASLSEWIIESGVSSDQYYFISWASSGAATVPFSNLSTGINSTRMDGGNIPPSPYAGVNETNPAALFLAFPDYSIANASDRTWRVENCSLYNASYSVDFSFAGGVQTVQGIHSKLENSITLPPSNSTIRALETDTWPNNLAFADADTRSYLAFMEAMQDVLTGSLYSTKYRNVTDHTRIMQTDLAFTNELYPITVGWEGGPGVQSDPKYLQSLRYVLQQMVRNMTISLLSEPDFLGSGVETLVNINGYYNLYNYDWRVLWCAYGAATVAMIAVVALGLFSVLTSGNSYSNKFSTVVRAARDDSLDGLIPQEDRRGQDPLPRFVGTIKLGISESEHHESDRNVLRPKVVSLQSHTEDELELHSLGIENSSPEAQQVLHRPVYFRETSSKPVEPGVFTTF